MVLLLTGLKGRGLITGKSPWAATRELCCITLCGTEKQTPITTHGIKYTEKIYWTALHYSYSTAEQTVYAPLWAFVLLISYNIYITDEYLKETLRRTEKHALKNSGSQPFWFQGPSLSKTIIKGPPCRVRYFWYFCYNDKNTCFQNGLLVCLQRGYIKIIK